MASLEVSVEHTRYSFDIIKVTCVKNMCVLFDTKPSS